MGRSRVGADNGSMSILMSATVVSSGYTGLAAYQNAPSRPCSSAVTCRKTIDRSNGPAAISSRAISTSPTVPEALSQAPL